MCAVRDLKRRDFLALAPYAAMGAALRMLGPRAAAGADRERSGSDDGNSVRLFLAGDVMTGRGIDQILPHPNLPQLYEGYMQSARGYVALAEDVSGPIPRRVAFDYVWGDALAELAAHRPAVRLVNLETAVTGAAEPWPGKGIHYRMHPDNVGCLTAAALDCCVLANNHTLDWREPGLLETLRTLRAAGIAIAGAGEDARHALAPAALPLAGGRRLLVFALGCADAGVPAAWAATAHRAGIAFLPDLESRSIDRVIAHIAAARRPGDLVLLSMHWGGNWGHYIERGHRDFAHALIDAGAVDVIHGHSSHHPRAVEVYRERLVLYGCGDLLNDYEGIPGHEEFRPGLALMYFPVLGADGRLLALDMAAVRTRRFRLERANAEDTRWLGAMLSREGARFGTAAAAPSGHALTLAW